MYDLVIVVPWDTDADWVPLDLPIEGVVGGHGIEEFPPDQLTHDTEVKLRRWTSLVNLSNNKNISDTVKWNLLPRESK